MDIICGTLPKKVMCDAIAREFTKFLIMKDSNEENDKLVLVHTSDIRSEDMSVVIEHYILGGEEPFIKIFTENKDYIMTIPMDLISRISSMKIEEYELQQYLSIITRIYEFMERTSSTITNYTPPIRIMEVGEEKEEKD